MITFGTITIQDVKTKINKTLHVEGEVKEVLDYVQASPGKMLRPLLVILCFDLCQGTNYENALNGATGVELIHLASLVHDDIIDTSDLRRGRETLHRYFSTQLAVLTGDFLFAGAFRLFALTNQPKVSELMTAVIQEMCTGEIRQLLRPLDTEADYWVYIRQKTACLIGGACALGALLANEPKQASLLQQFGEYLGIAFQLTDDVLDYAGAKETLGKQTGDDYAKSLWTLPTLLAFQRGLIPHDWHNYQFEEIISRLEQGEILTEIWALAEEYVHKAKSLLATLAEGVPKQQLLSLADDIVRREH